MTERHRLLLVDDDAQLTQFLGARLRRDGFDVTVAGSGADALAAIDEAWPDLVLLDLMMPGIGGEEVAAGIKRRADIPIVVLSAVATSRSKTELIEHYAEDYVTKPFDYPELVARIHRVLRRLNERIPSELLDLGPQLSLALRRREAVVAGHPVALSPTETRMLATLAANLGTTITTDQLLARVWSDSDGADPAYVWVAIRRLRRKIEVDPDEPRHLLTDRGGGYRLVAVG
jgi:DNA-binding response OmpR family regulator